ncbi:hypothetical protein NPX13_g1756 [Xylaria arbuscula]|uniref:Uncharacterized protein n=1 Tax=Xylaria arbuscula TaxID=114810 RepID=A0A9W8TR05_9PEZI|nr:hypothetical protein NPX13_g1756 [Xylaria arbuscula]
MNPPQSSYGNNEATGHIAEGAVAAPPSHEVLQSAKRIGLCIVCRVALQAMIVLESTQTIPYQSSSRFLVSPTRQHLEAAKNVLLYLDGTRDNPLLFVTNIKHRHEFLAFGLIVCIIQDSLSGDDWLREADLFGKTYGNALLNISADAGSNPRADCF